MFVCGSKILQSECKCVTDKVRRVAKRGIKTLYEVNAFSRKNWSAEVVVSGMQSGVRSRMAVTPNTTTAKSNAYSPEIHEQKKELTL